MHRLKRCQRRKGIPDMADMPGVRLPAAPTTFNNQGGGMKKSNKSYYDLLEENRWFRRRENKRISFYVFGAILFYLAIMVETATVGNFILKKIDLQRYAAEVFCQAEPSGIVVTVSSDTWETTTGEIYYVTENNNSVLVRGACVDKAQAIVNMLKRRYVSFDRIKVAACDNHVQVVRQNIDGTITFLDEDNWDVVVGNSEFPYGFHTLLDPQDFLDAIAYFKPEISVFELNDFLNARYPD